MSIIHAVAAGFLCVTATASIAQEFDESMAVTIDDRSAGDVRTGAQVRRALMRCSPPRTCRYVGLSADPQIDYAAVFERGGYTIQHRTGPPGPLWDARRKGKGNATHFTTREMIAITADYLDGKRTAFVRWKPKDLSSE